MNDTNTHAEHIDFPLNASGWSAAIGDHALVFIHRCLVGL